MDIYKCPKLKIQKNFPLKILIISFTCVGPFFLVLFRKFPYICNDLFKLRFKN